MNETLMARLQQSQNMPLQQFRKAQKSLLAGSIFGHLHACLERVETLSRLHVESTVAELKLKTLKLLNDLDDRELISLTYERLADIRSLVGDLESPTSVLIDCKKSLKDILEKMSKDYASLKETSPPDGPSKKYAPPPGPDKPQPEEKEELVTSEKIGSTPANIARPVVECIEEQSKANVDAGGDLYSAASIGKVRFSVKEQLKEPYSDEERKDIEADIKAFEAETGAESGDGPEVESVHETMKTVIEDVISETLKEDPPPREPPIGLENVDKVAKPEPYKSRPGFITRVAAKVTGIDEPSALPEKEISADNKIKKIVDNLEVKEMRNFEKDSAKDTSNWQGVKCDPEPEMFRESIFGSRPIDSSDSLPKS